MGALTLLSAAAHAGSAPKELYGKSIIVNWTAHRSQRPLGQGNFRDVNIPLSHKFYFGTTGRLFNRLSSTSKGYEAAHEVVGTSGTSPGGGPRQIQFSDRTIVLTFTNGDLAHRITIEFNEGFTTCEAQIVSAKPAGANVSVITRNLYGEQIEVRFATVTGVSCSVRDGNVFAQ